MRPEIKYNQKKIGFALKKFLFTLLFIAGEMKCNFIPGVVGVTVL